MTFFDSVLADCGRMIHGPVPRKEMLVVGAAGHKLVEDVFDVQPNVQVVPNRAAGESQEARRAFAASNASRE